MANPLRFLEFAKILFPAPGSDYGVDAAKLAAALDTTPAGIYPYLKGHREPGASMLARVAVLGGNAHWLVAGEGSMFAPNDAGRALAQLHNAPLPEISPERVAISCDEVVSHIRKVLDAYDSREARN